MGDETRRPATNMSLRTASIRRAGARGTHSNPQASSTRTTWAARRVQQQRRGTYFVVRAMEEETEASDEDFEARLAKLRAAKGTTGRGQGGTKSTKKSEEGPAKVKKVVDYTNETVFFDSKPSAGDLAVNVALGATLLWLPLSIAAVGRYLWVNYKITDKRISVSNTSPTSAEQTDVGYDEVRDVVALGRGLGFWGDMVINLKDGSKVEIRSIDKWQEIKKYIEDRVQEVSSESSPVEQATAKGF